MPRYQRLAIMQPYFMPYLGYWQLLNYVDAFVLYDDAQFTKKGWIHRNRYLNNGRDQIFSLPIKKDSDYLNISERLIADSWRSEKNKLKRKITAAYKKSPFYDEVYPAIETCLNYDGKNLFNFVHNSIKIICDKLNIATEILISSDISDSRHLKSQERVLHICAQLDATEYINPIGGRKLYNECGFKEKGVKLKFHRIGMVKYDQLNNDFIPNLSIIDMLMFTGFEGVKDQINNFELVV